eukprot:CAMPEP_0184870138 /NCGR_PEP_ID=MMETSP0580-20130426/36597_1 /TAXON_ID=1118495 /ORGANISM="Dactyliosolen fragilissimus" /LENGTH=372 /DNA_ID=CAMNT_0027372077 /DNA_START=23 /DNA_END=1141 /DNA_ORIENTATION=-
MTPFGLLMLVLSLQTTPLSAFHVSTTTRNCWGSNGLKIRSDRYPSLISMNMNKPKGCAAIPFEKKKIAVFGAGGYLGATAFGFLQRASSLYGTGIAGGSSSPRCMAATAAASANLNKILGRSFNLAYAGEDLLRLTNMEDIDAIALRLKSIDAAILGTVCQLEVRPVTSNTYETSPNSKALEFYLDDRNNPNLAPENEDMDVHFGLFGNAVLGCNAANVKHLVVIETPGTGDSQPFLDILKLGGIPFTYIVVDGSWDNTKYYTFEKGVQSDLQVDALSLNDEQEAALQQYTDSTSIVYREDVAALAVQSLMSLDWTKSRCLQVSSNGNLHDEAQEKLASKDTYVPYRQRVIKTDNQWCVNSHLLAEKLVTIE